MKTKRETELQRFYKQLAESADWYARNICRKGEDAGFRKIEKEAKDKLKKLDKAI